MIDIESPVEEFEREHKITEVILLGDDGAIRRILLEWKIFGVIYVELIMIVKVKLEKNICSGYY